MSNSRFAICLFNDEIKDLTPSELIAGENLQKVNFKGKTKSKVLLYQRKSELAIPAWVDILKEFGDFKYEDLKTASSGAILFVKIGNRIMGCCFGTSVANVNRNNIETNFGLGVVYQRMMKNQTKSIASFTLAHNPITNNRSSTIPTTKNSFDIDDYLENITELSGYFYRNSTRTLIKGKEFFSSPSPKTLKDIIEICKLSLSDYKTSSQDENFKKLTATRWIKDKKTIEELEKEMCKMMNKKSNDIYLVDYESFDNISGYKLSPKGETMNEINISAFYDNLGKSKLIDIGYLKNKRIFPINESSEIIANWSIHKCLFAEFKIGKNFFILYKGKWYEIDENYLSGLRTYIEQFEVDIDFLTAWNGKDDEGKFNEDAAIELKGQCWDKILYGTPQYSYKIEFCDILTEDYIFHVKKYEGSQLTSHLLMQTSVSAQLLNSDFEIKKWISEVSNDKFMGKNLLFDSKNEFKKSNVGYFILLMTQRKGKLSKILPFFSLITMHLTIKRVVQLGFDVKIGKI